MRHYRGRALRRRYGRSTAEGSPISIEQEATELFSVRLARDYENQGKIIPAGTRLGFINERGTIKISRPAGYVPRGYGDVARVLLEDAKIQLKSQGRIMAKQRARELAEEQAQGSFIAKIDGGPTLRAHDMPRMRAKVEEELLKYPVGTQAKFFRAGPATWEDGRPLVGAPWTEPFHIEEVYEWNNQKRVGMPRGPLMGGAT